MPRAATRAPRQPAAGSALEAALLLQLRAAGLPEPEQQTMFARPRRWRFDFAWPERLVALEVDGATWSGGRHTRGSGYEADCEKLNTAAILGWRVLRVTRRMIESGLALALVERALSR